MDNKVNQISNGKRGMSYGVKDMNSILNKIEAEKSKFSQKNSNNSNSYVNNSNISDNSYIINNYQVQGPKINQHMTHIRSNPNFKTNKKYEGSGSNSNSNIGPNSKF
jgi:hypothetical protein